jgi:alkanesulfonate monooxygenase
VVTGGEAAEQRAYGDFLGKAQRYQRCAEFLDIATRLWRGETVSHDGEHLPILRQRGRWQHPAPDNADDLGGTTPFAPTSGPAHSAAVS